MKQPKQLNCPILQVMGDYNISRKGMLNVVRMNWRMTLLEIIAGGNGRMHYNKLLRVSGLNPRTLSLVLGDLARDKFVKRIVEPGPGISVTYGLTDAGSKIAMSGCLLLEIAGDTKGRRVVAQKRR